MISNKQNKIAKLYKLCISLYDKSVQKDNFVSKISSLGYIQSGYAFKTKEMISDKESNNNIVKIANISNLKVQTKNALSFTNEIGERIEKFVLNDGDVLLAMTGATVGKVGLYSQGNKIGLLNQRVARISSRNNEHYLLFILLMLDSTLDKVKTIANGAAQPNISVKQLEEIEIIVPKDLDSILSYIVPIVNLCLSINKDIRNLYKLKSLKLKKYFY